MSVFTIAGDFVCCTETWSTRLGYLEDVEVLDNGDVCLPVMSAEGNKVIVLSGMTLDDVSMNPDGTKCRRTFSYAALMHFVQSCTYPLHSQPFCTY